jgi:hypothetical protein
MRGRTIGKIVVGTAGVAVLAWLFVRSARSTLAEPYVIDAGTLSGWTLVTGAPDRAEVAWLALQPPAGLTAELFRQIFQRSMLSLTAPAAPGIPLLLRTEYPPELQTLVRPDEVLDAARRAGLERDRVEPVCVGVRQGASAGRSHQQFFAVFEIPAFMRFREEIARLVQERQERGGPAFDPGALGPVLPIAASEGDAASWGALDVGPSDCQAPLAAAERAG